MSKLKYSNCKNKNIRLSNELRNCSDYCIRNSWIAIWSSENLRTWFFFYSRVFDITLEKQRRDNSEANEIFDTNNIKYVKILQNINIHL